MYVKRTWRCGKCIEVEKYQTFRYKGKMTVRGPQSNPTPEAMAKVNERNSYIPGSTESAALLQDKKNSYI